MEVVSQILSKLGKVQGGKVMGGKVQGGKVIVVAALIKGVTGVMPLFMDNDSAVGFFSSWLLVAGVPSIKGIV